MLRLETRNITKPTEVILGATCDNCGIELKASYTNQDGTWGSVHSQDTLEITLNGGYGQYYDGPTAKAVFCKACADKLCREAFPSLMKAIGDAEREWTPDLPEGVFDDIFPVVPNTESV